MSKKKDKQEVVNEEVLKVNEPEITINGEDVEKPEEENITPDMVNVEAGAPEINSEEEPENVEQTTEGETEPEEEPENEVVEEMVTLKINKNFTDKYDKSIKYVKGKKYEFTADRAKELLADERDLVSKVK